MKIGASSVNPVQIKKITESGIKDDKTISPQLPEDKSQNPPRFDSADFDSMRDMSASEKLDRRKKERAEAARQKMEENKQNAQQLQEELKQSKESADAEAKAMQEKFKCLEVFRRISSGAKVPRKDEQKLMKFDHKLYELAKQLAAMKQERNKKVYDSLWDDEEENAASEEEVSGVQEVSCEPQTQEVSAAIEAAPEAAQPSDSE